MLPPTTLFCLNSKLHDFHRIFSPTLSYNWEASLHLATVEFSQKVKNDIQPSDNGIQLRYRMHERKMEQLVCPTMVQNCDIHSFVTSLSVIQECQNEPQDHQSDKLSCSPGHCYTAPELAQMA